MKATDYVIAIDFTSIICIMKLRKITASIMAATTLAVSMVGMSASAVGNSQSWETYHTKTNAPVYSGIAAYVTTVYSTKGAMCYQRGVRTSTNGGQGYLSIISDNGTMPIATMYRGDVSKKCVPEYNGAVPHSEFTLRAVSETYNSTYTCYGEMQTIE